MSLQETLDAIKADFEASAPADAVATMHKSTQELRASGILEQTIKEGDKLPPFTLNNQDKEAISSVELLAKGPLIISFFRGIWCPYCNAELEALHAWNDRFAAAGAQLIAISPQKEIQSAKLKRDKSLSFDILADAQNNLARQLRVAFELPADLKAIYQKFGIDLAMYHGDDSWTLPMPTRLVVDQSGLVIHADIDPDYTVRPDPSLTLDALLAGAWSS